MDITDVSKKYNQWSEVTRMRIQLESIGKNLLDDEDYELRDSVMKTANKLNRIANKLRKRYNIAEDRLIEEAEKE